MAFLKNMAYLAITEGGRKDSGFILKVKRRKIHESATLWGEASVDGDTFASLGHSKPHWLKN